MTPVNLQQPLPVVHGGRSVTSDVYGVLVGAADACNFLCAKDDGIRTLCARSGDGVLPVMTGNN
jgi:hypothetical protein